MSLRKHQAEVVNIIDGIINGSQIKTIYCHCTPGAGKSILPLIVGSKLIKAGLADKLAWVAPRLSLTEQAEKEFVNPFFRKMLNHNIAVRQSTNENNPCRGLHGFSTTYNAIGIDDGLLRLEFMRYRYILIMDEFHHVQADSLWHKKLAPLFELAAFKVLMTGTLERGDGNLIAFTPYRRIGKTFTPDLQDGPDTAIVRYTRADALAEKAIIPLVFHLSDGSAEWEDRRGKKVSIPSMDKMGEADANKALYTALKTEYADHLLRSGIAHWQEHRKRYPSAKCLVVTSNIGEAKRHMRNLSGISARCDIATSEESEKAHRVINKLKAGELDVVVTVAMAYEGLNVPEISHNICLTRIRSTAWIEQCISRPNRVDPAAGPYDEQSGYIFAPADPLFKQVMQRIEKEQLPVMELRKTSSRTASGEETEGGGFRLVTAPGGITPLSSAMTGGRKMLLGSQRDFPSTGTATPEKTPSEQEAELRGLIDDHIRTYAARNRYHPRELNSLKYAHFQKARGLMTIPELESCLKYTRETYPLSFLRGSGHVPVSRKVERLNCDWS